MVDTVPRIPNWDLRAALPSKHSAVKYCKGPSSQLPSISHPFFAHASPTVFEGQGLLGTNKEQYQALQCSNNQQLRIYLAFLLRTAIVYLRLRSTGLL